MIETLPGAPAIPDLLARRLADAVGARAGASEERLPRYTNRLALERSPYLLQHAHNPVNWYPWGEEAFEEARRTGRPMFLSVGYSACHWCHVMERESFEDEEIARVLNERYVAVKVDREERPDVDELCMAAVQLVAGGGGWPMSVWLTPEKEPFFAGTYFPPRDGDRGEARGLLGLLVEIADLWKRDPERIRGARESVVKAVRAVLATGGDPAEAAPGPKAIEDAVAAFEARFDDEHGGLGRAPKFPSSLPVRLLLRHHRRARDERSLHMASFTLERMAAGGIHDQLGGGFHRYSTDEKWLVPHFEKMLYDNSLAALAYTEAWQVTRRRDFARVARRTLDWILDELASPEGGLYGALDADSEGEEGRFFTWGEREIRDVLGADADELVRFFGVTPEGNFDGRNVLWVPRPDEAAWDALARSRERLLEARSRRPRPLRDELVLASWNGLAISALAFGGRVLAEPRWIAAAARAAEFVLGEMVRDGRLRRSWAAGVADVPAFLDDHAFLAHGLLDLYEATFEVRWLEAARDVAERLEALFGDPRGGGWFTTAPDHEPLLARTKPAQDGAEPSGASIAVLVALRLSAFTADDRWRRIADSALRHHAHTLETEPAALTEMLLALDFATDSAREVVLVWPAGQGPPEPFLSVLRETFLPNRALAGAPEGTGIEALGSVALVAASKVAVGGRPTAYVCEKGQCRLPAIEPEKLASQIAPVKPYR